MPPMQERRANKADAKRQTWPIPQKKRKQERPKTKNTSEIAWGDDTKALNTTRNSYGPTAFTSAPWHLLRCKMLRIGPRRSSFWASVSDGECHLCHLTFCRVGRKWIERKFWIYRIFCGTGNTASAAAGMVACLCAQQTSEGVYVRTVSGIYEYEIFHASTCT